MSDTPRILFEFDDRSAAEKVRGEAFLRDIVKVYEAHGLSLSHEDSHGAFIVEPLQPGNVEWLLSATLDPLDPVTA